jgi:ABC-type phosphate transport system substrate-binding protein
LLETAVLCQRVLAVWLLIAGWSAVAVAKDLALVSNKANSLTEVSMPDLIKICTGQTHRWPKGRPVTLFTRSPASPEMKLALEKIYGLSRQEVEDLIATANHGRANHPAIIVLDSNQALVEAVASTPGAVGLVDVYSITGAITVLRIEGKLPLEAGYPLHGN